MFLWMEKWVFFFRVRKGKIHGGASGVWWVVVVDVNGESHM
jgi:hypothetical protein